MRENNENKDKEIRKKLRIHGNCGRRDPQKCSRGVLRRSKIQKS